MTRKFKGLEQEQYYRGAMRWMAIGIEFAIVCGMCAAVGYWLDTLEGTQPGWMILGFFVGFGIMVHTMLKRAQKSNEEIEKDSKSQDNGES
jgi:F0F1-type ATP synthase assembly protein I